MENPKQKTVLKSISSQNSLLNYNTQVIASTTANNKTNTNASNSANRSNSNSHKNIQSVENVVNAVNNVYNSNIMDNNALLNPVMSNFSNVDSTIEKSN